MADEKAYKKVKIVDSILPIESAGGADLPVTLGGEVVDVDVISPIQVEPKPGSADFPVTLGGETVAVTMTSTQVEPKPGAADQPVTLGGEIVTVEDFNQYFDRNYFCEFTSTGFPTFGTGYQIIYQRDQKFDIESLTLAGSVGNIYYRIIVDGFIIFEGFAPDHSSFYVANTIMNLNFNWVYHAVTQTLFFQPKLHIRCNSQLKIEAKTAAGLGTISLMRLTGNGR